MSNRTLALVLVLGFACSGAFGCRGTQAYVDWRPGLRASDFDGAFEFSLDEYDRFADQGEPHTLFDRLRGHARPEAAATMAELGERLAGGGVDRLGYAVIGLGGDGKLELLDDRSREIEGVVDWFAATPDRQWAALRSGDKLAVVIGQASAGIDLGTLLGQVEVHQFMMLVEGDELTVFALPEFGGAVAANEIGFVFSFRHLPGGREPWDITVARVSVTM